ncbi:hypothetical protein KIN20_000003 [Parelaphostrongylus tenuis]|uniref:Uncharacterized protein n=1 Tax=Parelaphostrongylus tenuis TaxID=148309 RepID=A0AAD5QB60_PARTN|nr:hypothetical protein KIN20_000003 [Parelaphostrongylus tenuis]
MSYVQLLVSLKCAFESNYSSFGEWCKESNSAVRSASELALVYAFHFQDGQDEFDAYLQSVEGAAKTVLSELQPALRRVVKTLIWLSNQSVTF